VKANLNEKISKLILPIILTSILAGIAYNLVFFMTFGVSLVFFSFKDIIFNTVVLLPIVVGGILVAMIAGVLKKDPDSSFFSQGNISIKSIANFFMGTAGMLYLVFSFLYPSYYYIMFFLLASASCIYTIISFLPNNIQKIPLVCFMLIAIAGFLGGQNGFGKNKGVRINVAFTNSPYSEDAILLRGLDKGILISTLESKGLPSKMSTYQSEGFDIEDDARVITFIRWDNIKHITYLPDSQSNRYRL
jgi:hypothetical protein